MSKYFKKGSVPFKIFALFISVVLVLGCAFVPKSALGVAHRTDPPTDPLVPPDDTGDEGGDTGGDVKETNNDMELLLDPSAHGYDDWFKLENEDPYGNKEDEAFMLMEQNEVFSLQHYNKDDIDEICSMYGDYTPGATGKFGGSFKSDDKAAESGIPGDIMWTDAIQTVAFSPSSDFPQKDHIAVIGFIWDNGNKQVRLWVYNARDNKWSDSKTIGNLSWADVDGTSFYGDLEPYMSITAGDYNGDHRDSVVTYFGDCNSSDYGITEWAISDGPDGKPSINQASKDSNFSLLNKAYAAGGVDDMKKIYDSTDHQAAGKGSLHLILKTGDFDGDGIDDVAALSSLEFYKSDHAKQYDWRLGIPYLAICQGKNNGSFLNGDTYYGAYVGNYDEGTKTADTVNIANFAVARLWKHGADAIIIGGASFHFEGSSDDKLQSSTHTNDLKMARYDLVEKKDDKGNIISEDFGLFSFVNQCYDSYSSSTNPPLKNMSVHDYSLKCNYEKNYAWNPICAQAVYMNGKGNDPYILMDGDLYHWKKGSTYPQKVFDYSGMDGDNYEHFAQHFCPLACTCAGAWDGNDQGFEQVVFGMCSRQGGTDQDDDDYRVAFITIGISPDKHDSLTALPTGVTQKAELPFDVGYSSSLFFSTAENGKNHDEDYTINDKGSTSGHGLNFALCNMDYRDDGLTAKYKGQNIIYSDPVVQYILQAAPYWEEEVGTAAGETKVTKEFTLEREVSAKNEITEDDGFNVGGSFGGKRWGIGANLKCGSTQGFAKKYSGKMGTKRSISSAAAAETTVTVSRYPFYYYNYETYDPETQDWNQDMCVTSLAWHHILTVSLTPEWYNKFVDEYNESYKQMCIDNQELYKGLSAADQEKYKNFGNKLLSQPESKLEKLDTVQDADLFNCDGKPQYYKRIVNGSVDTANNVVVVPCTDTINLTGNILEDGGFWTLGASNSWESSRGLHFGYDLNLDFHNDTSKRHQRHTWSFNVGIYSDFAQMWGIGTTNSFGYTAGFNFKAQRTKKEPISCEGAYWNSSLPVNPLNNNPADQNNWIPVVGYIVNLLNFSDPDPEIPNVTGKTFAEAKTELEGAGYNVLPNPIDETSTLTKGTVTRTDPSVGTKKAKGTNVQVYISKGDAIVPSGVDAKDTTSTKGNELNILDSFIGPKLAYADENNCINVSWDTGDNPSDCTYQVYTSINGEVYKVGKPIKGSEFQIDLENPSDDTKDVVEKLKNQDLPIYQFAISVINENGIESPMSGWVYFCSSKYFKESMSCYVSRNQVNSKSRLNLLIKHNGKKEISKLVDSISLKKDGSFVTSKWHGRTEITDLAFKDSFPYKLEDFKYLNADGRDCLYQVQLINKTNSEDIKNCIIRLDDGKDPTQRLLEAEILSNWGSPSAITEAINNPETHDAAEEKLLEIYDKINTTHGLKITGEAKDVYVAGINAYNHYYGLDKQKFDATPVVITIVVGCLLIALGVGLTFFLRNRKTAQATAKPKTTKKSTAKKKSKSKFGTY